MELSVFLAEDVLVERQQQILERKSFDAQVAYRQCFRVRFRAAGSSFRVRTNRVQKKQKKGGGLLRRRLAGQTMLSPFRRLFWQS
jgi:hypothetical protein